MTLPFRLLVITDWSLGDALLTRLDDALQAGPGIAVQHRHPEALGRQFFDEGTRLAALCARYGAPLFVNTRLDVALALGAHLHLPAHGMRASDARPHLPQRLISIAVHDETEHQPGADFAIVSPVFPPLSKPNDTRSPLGVEGFRRLSATMDLPTVALGGVTPANAAALPASSAVAVIAGVLHAPQPRAAAHALLRPCNNVP